MAVHTIRFGLATTYTWTLRERGGAAVANLTGCTVLLLIRRRGAPDSAWTPIALSLSGTPTDGRATLTTTPTLFETLTLGSMWDMEITASPLPNGSVNGHYPDGTLDTLQITR